MDVMLLAQGEPPAPKKTESASKGTADQKAQEKEIAGND